jgi:hypothetical protein
VKKLKRLGVTSETIRNLGTVDLDRVVGGIKTSGPPPCGLPTSVGAPSCTGCPSINVPCAPDTFLDCTVVITFAK